MVGTTQFERGVDVTGFNCFLPVFCRYRMTLKGIKYEVIKDQKQYGGSQIMQHLHNKKYRLLGE